MTLDPKKYVNAVLNHLVTMKAQVYATHISSTLSSGISGQIQENINILSKKVRSNKGEPPKGAKLSNERVKELTFEVQTKGGEKVKVISKSRKDDGDIWSAIAAKALEVKEFGVKTWVLLQKATALLASTCTRERVLNINDMDIKFKNSDLKVDWGKVK